MNCTLLDPELVRCLQCCSQDMIRKVNTLILADIACREIRLLTVDRTDITADNDEVLVNDTIA